MHRNPHVRTSLLVWLCLPWILSGTGLQIHAQSFEVRGTIHYEAYLNGTVDVSTTRDFSVLVDGCRWRIRTSVVGDCSYKEKSFQNGSLYNLTMFCATPSGRATNTYVGSIEADEIPSDDGSQINYLWLAYASFCYLDTEAGPALRPVCCLDDLSLRAERFKMPSILSRSSSAPNLAIWIAYLNDGYYRTRNDQGPIVFQVPAPFDKGFTNAIYSALLLTNIGTLQLPLQFEFTRFAVNHGPNTIYARTHIAGKASVTSVVTPPKDLSPEFGGRLNVMDNRFASATSAIGQIRYDIRDGIWENRDKLTNAVITKSSSLPQPALKSTMDAGRPWIFRALLAAGALLPLAVFYFVRSKPRT